MYSRRGLAGMQIFHSSSSVSRAIHQDDLLDEWLERQNCLSEKFACLPNLFWNTWPTLPYHDTPPSKCTNTSITALKVGDCLLSHEREVHSTIGTTAFYDSVRNGKR